MGRAPMATLAPPLALTDAWRGLGAWNAYFAFKLCLYWQGAIDFDAFRNLVFAAFLLLPLPPLWLHRLRHLVALPIGAGLLYADSWLPPFDRLLAQSEQISAFSIGYLLELAGRVINWHWVGLAFLLLLGYAFLANWVRMTVIVVALLLWLAVGPWVAQVSPVEPGMGGDMDASSPETVTASTAEWGTDAVGLSARLEAFYREEAQRRTRFTPAPVGSEAFEVLILNLCSISWNDMAYVGMERHPLLDRLDIVFENFNSATSYSGPAGLRLLQASCGQPPHDRLYGPTPPECRLFEQLRTLGFQPTLAMNHDGQFDGYLDEIRQGVGDEVPLMSPVGREVAQLAFEGSPVYRDASILEAWAREAGGAPRATFYNSISLHDGNRFFEEGEAGKAGLLQRVSAPYDARLRRLFDDLLGVIEQFDREGRKVAVILVGEHGAALRGDRMQFPGLREIPSPAITRVPAGVVLTGLSEPRRGAPLKVSAPTSYLALSELLARLVRRDTFGQPSVDWPGLIADLPATPFVAENENVVVMEVDGTPHVRLAGESWMPYPR